MNRIPLVDLQAQYRTIAGEIQAAIGRVCESARFVGGEEVEQFETAFAAAHGMKYAVGVANGTDALELALWGLGIGPGDEVLCPTLTFIATSEAVSNVGATPVFVDVDEGSYTLDVNHAEEVIRRRRSHGGRVRAIIPVHLYGQPADMDAILELAHRYELLVIEDAAQAHLAHYRRRAVGQFGAAACFSFYPGKNLGAYGDAGAVLTNDRELAERIRMCANHGRLVKYEHLFQGMNSRLDALQAAVLRVKLRHLERWIEARRAIAARYRNACQGKRTIQLPQELPGRQHTYHLFVVRVPERDRVLGALRGVSVDASVHYPIPLHLQPVYRPLGYRPGDFPRAEKICSEVLSLPLYPEMSEAHVGRVVETFLSAVGG